MDIHGKIRAVLAETLRAEADQGDRPLSEEDFLTALQRRGIVEEAMKELSFANVVRLLVM